MPSVRLARKRLGSVLPRNLTTRDARPTLRYTMKMAAVVVSAMLTCGVMLTGCGGSDTRGARQNGARTQASDGRFAVQPPSAVPMPSALSDHRLDLHGAWFIDCGNGTQGRAPAHTVPTRATKARYCMTYR